MRTTVSAVEGVLGSNYDGSSDLAPFIATASSIVDRLAARDTAGELAASQLELIERWLSAHCYVQMDQMQESDKTGKSSTKYQGQWGKWLDSSNYGQTAIGLDWSGNLRKLGKKVLGAAWLGLPPSEQTDYVDRD